MPTWEEIKAILDSPYVSAEKKNRIMDAYDRETFNFNDEEEEYAKKYLEGYAEGDNHGWAPEIGGDSGLQSAYDDAKADMEAGEAEEKQASDAKDRAQSTLQGISAPAAGGTGAQNSNELLDQGKPACDFFCKWIDQVWNKRPSGGQLDYMKEIWGRYNRDRNINFAKLLDDAEALEGAHKVIEDTMTSAKTELNTLFGEWKGEGATAARVKFEEKIQRDYQELAEHIDGAAKLIPETTTAVFNAVKTKVDSVLGLYRTTVAQAPLEMANKVVRIARKETDSKSDLLDVAGWVDSVCGSNLSERLQSDDCGLNDENRDYAYDLCAKWVANSFTPEFQSLLDAFNNHCETAHSTVEQQFGALADYLNDYRNGFTETAKTPAEQTQPSGDGGGPGSGGGGGGGGSMPGGGGSMPGGGGGGGSLPQAQVPGMEDPAAVSEAAKKEAEQGINPITGKPLELNPETGEPYPIDPKTGEVIKDTDEPETLTVRQGDNTIEISEPDADGAMGIKIDDGHGNAKEYQLDWGDGETGPEGSETSPDGAPAGDPAQGPGAPVQPGQTYTPGPDGKIHIQDGNLKITAERPEGPGGPTVVTVDDGSGEPTTYTLAEDGAKAANQWVDGGEPPAPVPPSGAGEGAPAGEPPAGEQGNTFAAPGGIDFGPAGAAPPEPSGMDSASGVSGMDSAGVASPSAEPAPGAAPGAAEPAAGADQQTTPAFAGEASADVGQATTPAGLFSDDLGSVSAGGEVGVGVVSGTLGDAGSLEVGATIGSDVSEPVPAALGHAPEVAGPAPAGGDHQAAVGGSGFGGAGMPGMMGGMAGAGGGGGEDTERSSRSYRVDGGIFDISGASGRISGSLLGEEDEQEARL